MAGLDRQSRARAGRIPVWDPSAGDAGESDFRNLEAQASDLERGDIYLNRFSPTGFYSSAVRNNFLGELQERSEHQVAYTVEPVGEHVAPFSVGARGRTVLSDGPRQESAEGWVAAGFTEALRTPDSTLIFVTPRKALEIRTDQIGCMGCLSACQFSNWAQNEARTTGKKADPRSFCIQKTLQAIRHSDDVEFQLMFAGHNAYRFASDPFLRKRLCADGARIGRTPADRRLSEPHRTIPVVYFRRAYHYICCMMMTSPSSTALERLRAAGLRPTRQRLALARLLLENGERHITAEQLHAEAAGAAIQVSLATVYNDPSSIHRCRVCFAKSSSNRAAPISTPTRPITITSSAKRPASCRTSRVGTWSSAAIRCRPKEPRFAASTSSSECAPKIPDGARRRG